jgi:hypothetical protein
MRRGRRIWGGSGRFLLITKDRRLDPARRIVDRAHQGQHRTAPLEPVVTAAIELQEQALCGHPLAATAVPRCSPSAGTCQPGPAQDPPETGAFVGASTAFSANHNPLLSPAQLLFPGQLFNDFYPQWK